MTTPSDNSGAENNICFAINLTLRRVTVLPALHA